MPTVNNTKDNYAVDFYVFTLTLSKELPVKTGRLIRYREIDV